MSYVCKRAQQQQMNQQVSPPVDTQFHPASNPLQQPETKPFNQNESIHPGILFVFFPLWFLTDGVCELAPVPQPLP